MSDHPAGPPQRKTFKLWDHIGVISAVVLGLVVLAFLVVLAAAGYEAALAMIVVLVVGIAFIFLGGRMRGGHGRT
jgi:amino acid transporter